MKAIPVLIFEVDYGTEVETLIEGDVANGIAFTNEALAAHDKRVAQEAFQAGRAVTNDNNEQGSPIEDSALHYSNFNHYWAEQLARKGDL